MEVSLALGQAQDYLRVALRARLPASRSRARSRVLGRNSMAKSARIGSHRCYQAGKVRIRATVWICDLGVCFPAYRDHSAARALVSTGESRFRPSLLCYTTD